MGVFDGHAPLGELVSERKVASSSTPLMNCAAKVMNRLLALKETVDTVSLSFFTSSYFICKAVRALEYEHSSPI